MIGQTHMRTFISIGALASLALLAPTDGAESRAALAQVALTPAATVAQTAAPAVGVARAPGWDQYENNYDFQHAAPIALGEEILANFACPEGASVHCGDNDFYQVQLKGGQCYRAQTRDLDPALDTNLIVFGSEQDLSLPLAGNDDAAPGELRSETQFCLPADRGSFNGYVLVGNAGNRTPPEPISERTYTLRIDVVAPPTPTPLPIATERPAQELSTEQLPRAMPANPPSQGVAHTDREIAWPATEGFPGITLEEIPSAQAALPTPRPLLAVPISIRACYDRNQNKFCDVDEGISGLTVYATNTQGQVIGQALTDRTGVAQFSLRVEEDEQISISVPYFAAQQTVAARAPRLKDILITTVAPLPALLP